MKGKNGNKKKLADKPGSVVHCCT